MKKFILTALIPLMFTSCGSLFKVTSYDVSLKAVESPADSKVQYGETKVIKVEQEGLSKYQYEDDYIKIFWYVTSTQFNFDITNKTNHTIKLPWDDMAYVDQNGSTKRVMHSGVKYTERNSSQPASTLPRNASLSDVLLPTDNVYYVSGQYGGWREASLFPRYNTQEEAQASPALGKSVRIIFPILIQDVVNEYVFEFSVDSVTVK
ncbi:MAG: hypothetical protein J6U70_03330 [Bacteroidales bacterium]|nr:hypothetical protein [Bacteroidales bacterium]